VLYHKLSPFILLSENLLDVHYHNKKHNNFYVPNEKREVPITCQRGHSADSCPQWVGFLGDITGNYFYFLVICKATTNLTSTQ
jgi:hypothetical protein